VAQHVSGASMPIIWGSTTALAASGFTVGAWWYQRCLFVYTTTHRSLKAYCAILVRRSKFRYQASPRVSPPESTQRRKVELWARNVR